MARPLYLYAYVLLVALPVAAGNTGASSLDDAPLLEQLLEQPAVGKGSCRKIGRLARAALKPPTPALAHAAKLSSANAERDLHRWVVRQAWRRLLPHPYAFVIILQDKIHVDRIVVSEHHAMLPHDVFHNVFTYAPKLF